MVVSTFNLLPYSKKETCYVNKYMPIVYQGAPPLLLCISQYLCFKIDSYLFGYLLVFFGKSIFKNQGLSQSEQTFSNPFHVNTFLHSMLYTNSLRDSSDYVISRSYRKTRITWKDRSLACHVIHIVMR
jgi:hypothetical protein